MGTPRLKELSVGDITDILSTAKNVAVHFREPAARVDALEGFCALLTPLVEWLDVPIDQCFISYNESFYTNAPKRMLPVFRSYGSKMDSVALARDGQWHQPEDITLFPQERAWVLKNVSSGELVQQISENRLAILGAIPWGHPADSVRALEARFDIRPVIEHVAFTRYLGNALEEVGRCLKEREERIKLMRSNLDVLRLFTQGVDPCSHITPARAIESYGVFRETERGTSRVTGDYYVRALAEKEKDGELQTSRDKSIKHWVETSNTELLSLDRLISELRSTADGIGKVGCLGRSDWTAEEVAAVNTFLASL